MKKILTIPILFTLIITHLPIVNAAPDTPPTLLWETQLTETGTSCVNNIAVNQLDVDTDNNIWALSECTTSPGNTGAGFITKLDGNSGLPLCNILFGLDRENQPATGQLGGFAWTPLGPVVYGLDTAGVFQGHTLLQFDQDTCEIIGSVTPNEPLWSGFTNPSFDSSGSNKAIAWSVANSTALYFWLGGSSTNALLRCNGPVLSGSSCEMIWTRSATKTGEHPYRDSPYFNGTFYVDSSGDGSVPFTRKITGQGFTNGISDWDYTWSGIDDPYWTGPWIKTSNPTQLVTVSRFGASNTKSTEITHHNITTGTAISQIVPIEPIVAGWDGNRAFAGYLDAEDNYLICGETQSIVNVDDYGFFAVYNTTSTPGMRWNITISKSSGLSDPERVSDCLVSRDGSIFIGHRVAKSGATDYDSYIRKYEGTMVAREREDLTGFSGFETTLPPSPSPNGLTPLNEILIGICALLGIVEDNEQGMFLCGIIYLFSFMATIGFLSMRTGLPIPTMVTVAFVAGIVGLGFIGIWPVWTVVVVGLVSALVLSFLIKRGIANI